MSATMQPPGYLEATLPAEIDVHEHYIRPQLADPLHRLSARRRHAWHRDSLALQQVARGVQESQAVIDDKTPKHRTRIAHGRWGRHSWYLEGGAGPKPSDVRMESFD